MTEKVSIKLVGAERYVSPLTNNEVIEKNGIIEVDEAAAEQLKADIFVDALNYEHPVWVDAESAAAKEKPARRTASKSA